ncbi:uncharacterized protein LOC128246452 [Mya arenaria]|uniref:uncharacterized protein LOC128246452 n=1 Tax=Mya arenaria TaxID=6604 RepID=UPI0022E24B95|nr:uncharacterized protein LOC128246452 [Mya arenaria]
MLLYTAVCAAFFTFTNIVIVAPLNKNVEQIFKTIQSLQVKKDAEFRVFPLQWQAQHGVYPSEVRLNFHGDEQYYAVRELFKIPDTNMFAPAWVTSCIIEAYAFGKAPKPGSEQLKMSLEAVSTFTNRNKPGSDSKKTFWPQVLNKTDQTYTSTPVNLFEVLRFPDYLPNSLIEELLEIIGLKDLEHVYELLVKERHIFAEAFHIPPDFDDTFVNVGLGSMLAQFAEDFPSEQQQWMADNSHLQSVFDNLKKYAYRPLSSESRVNTIDPRTYLYMHGFLEKAVSNQQDVALVTTWLQDIDEVKTMLDRGVAMPFSVNNVDITVCANVLYGLTTCLGTGLCKGDWVDSDIQQIYMNTTALLAYEMSTNLSSRPDLALTYYPSRFVFYRFTSRTFAWLNRFLPGRIGKLDANVFKMLNYAYESLCVALKTYVTQDILTIIQDEGHGCYIDDFLGNNDFDLFNRSVNRAEDRIFSTAVSANALISTYTIWSNGSLLWTSDTPTTVHDRVHCLIQWLSNNVLSTKYKPWNAFFSGSGKGRKSLPFFYPANRMEYFNGTKFTDKTFPTDIHNIIGMQRVVSPSLYDAMLKQPHFGQMTPMTFDGYNSEPGMFFPFWSSEAFTYATSLVAISHYDNIANN